MMFSTKVHTLPSAIQVIQLLDIMDGNESNQFWTQLMEPNNRIHLIKLIFQSASPKSTYNTIPCSIVVETALKIAKKSLVKEPHHG